MEFSLPKIAKNLRKKSTPHEIKLWKALRDRRFLAVKFRRQQVLGPFIVDFCSFEKKIIIELDGGGHSAFLQKSKDKNRDYYFKSVGYQILRFWNNELDSNFLGVLDEIEKIVISPSPQPSPSGGRGGE